MVDSSKCFGAKIPDLTSKFQTQFYIYSHGLTFPHSLQPLSLHQKVIQHNPMVSIYYPLNPGGRSNKDTAFIQCVDGRDPHIHEVRSLGLDNITHKVHPKALVDIIAGTVGEFVTNYIAKNGGRIQIIGQLSINRSAQFLVVPTQALGHGLPFPCNPQTPAGTTG